MDVRLFCPCVRVLPPPFVSTAGHLTRHTSFSHIPSRYGSFHLGLDTYTVYVIYYIHERIRDKSAHREQEVCGCPYGGPCPAGIRGIPQ